MQRDCGRDRKGRNENDAGDGGAEKAVRHSRCESILYVIAEDGVAKD